MRGKGIYDDLLTEAREKARANGGILIIIEGERGFGFSVQAEPSMIARLPQALRYIADEIQRDLDGPEGLASLN
jgi:hypothetical protein